MASYYFDLNGSTAGFGTLTGAWNTSSAFWSTSSAGTAVPAAVTFNSADTANFGFAGTTATAGTATIADGVTVTLNSIVTANLAGLQIIARTTSGALTLAGTTPTINVGSAGNLTISAPIGGTDGLTKSGANTLTLSGANTFSGSVSISAGTLSVTNALGLGSNTARVVTVTSGAVLSLGASITGSNLTPDISGTGISGINDGAVVLATAVTANLGAITLGASASIRAAATATLSSSILTASGRNLTLQGAPTFTGTFSGAITGAGALIAGGTAGAGLTSQTGTVTLSSTTNSYTGNTTVSTGTLTVSGRLGLGSYAGDISIASGATFSYTSTSNQTLSGVISGLGTVTKTTGTSSVLVLTGSNTFSTAPNLLAGTVSVTSIGNASASSPIGTNGTVNFGAGANSGTLRYTGSGETTDKVANLANTTGAGGATIENNGTGALVFTAAITGANGGSNSRPLTLSGSSTHINDFQGVIANVGGGAGGTALTKSGVGYWKATGTNTYTGNVTVSGGQLEIPALSALGSGTKTISITATNRNGSMLLSGASVTYPSTLSWSLNSFGQDQTNSSLGAIRALADSTIAGTVTLAGGGGFYADTGDLTISGNITGASTIQARAAAGRTVNINGGISGTGRLTTFGPGTAVWLGSAANTATLSTIINGGTLRLALNGSLSQYAFTILSFGATAAQTASPTSRHQYTGGTVEFSNSGASGAINYAGLTATNALDLARGSGKVKLSRDSTAGSFTATFGNTSGPTAGVLTIEYAGTVGTIGTDSSIIFNGFSASAGDGRFIISDGAALVPVWRTASKVAVPMVFDGSQANVAASQAGGTTLTLITGNVAAYNVTGAITAQETATSATIRLDASGTIALAAGAVLKTQFLMDVATGAARTIVSAPSGGKLSRQYPGGSGTLAVYTDNVTGTGATISADIDARVNTGFTKAGAGILTLTGAVDNLAGFNLADGSVSFTSTSSFNNPFATLTIANKDSGESVPATNATFAQAAPVTVAGLSGGGANTAVTLNGGDLVVRNGGSSATFGGDIALGGSQKLKVRSIATNPEGVTQSFQGAFPFTAIEMSRGYISLDPQYGTTVTGTPSVTITGGGRIDIQAQNPLSADYTVNLGAISITNGVLRIQLVNATAFANPYATRISATSFATPTGDDAASLLAQTANGQNTFTIPGTPAGPMGSGVNVWNGSSIAFYRTEGQPLAGGGTAPVGGTVDLPIYGTDANFSASKTGGASFTSAGSSDNVSVTGNYTAQTSVTVKSLRTVSNITLGAGQRLTTNLIVIGGGTPVLSGGEIATQTGNLYLNSNAAANTISSSIVNGTVDTRLIIYANNSPTLSGTNSHSGGTVINGGSNNPIILNSTSAFGTGPVIGNGGVGCSIGASVTTFTFAAGNAITLNDGGLRLDASAGKDYVFNGKITGGSAGTGDLYVTGAGNYTFGAAFNSGTDTTAGSLRMSSTGTVALNAVQGFTEYDFGTSSTMVFRYGTGITDDISGKLSLRPSSYYRIDTNGQDITWASSFGNGSTYVKVGSGTHTLGAENFLATVTVTTGTVKAGHVAALGYGSVTLSAATALQTLTTGGQNGKLTVASLTNSAGGTIRIGG